MLHRFGAKVFAKSHESLIARCPDAVLVGRLASFQDLCDSNIFSCAGPEGAVPGIFCVKITTKWVLILGFCIDFTRESIMFSIMSRADTV